MDYFIFSLLFLLSHTTAYIIAGLIALKISKEIYESKNRYCDFLRDMSDKDESKHVSSFFLIAQFFRGLLMSVVLFPLLNTLIDFSFILKLIFVSSLMFVFTHIAAVSPFIDNIEGFVYFKKKYIKGKIILKFQLEMVIYSVLFGLFMSLLLGLTF